MAPALGAEVAKLGMVSTTSDYTSVVSINLFVALLCACIVIGHLLEESRWMNESITALIIGLCTGVVILLTTKGKSSRVLVFSEDLFFIYLLPPIIFNAGFQVKKKQFFRNFMTIMLFGAVGTLISFFVISLGAIGFLRNMDIGSLDIGDFLAIGAIFSATDSVCTLQVLNQDETPLLYSLVFGEGVLNDATSVVLFNAIQNFDLVHIDAIIILRILGNFIYLFVTSTLLGAFGGLLSAYVIKKLYFGRHSTDREVALMILMAYLTYMLAELSDLSGILTVFFCGIVMSHYTWHNVTESSRVTIKLPTVHNDGYGLHKSTNSALLCMDGLRERIREHLDKLELSASSYETAWVAMVPSPESPQTPCFPHCLQWILDNQHPDGSWGFSHFNPSLIKDSLSSTLACILALSHWKLGQEHVSRGLKFIGDNFSSSMNDQLPSLIGFNIIFPGMLEYAINMGIHLPVKQRDIAGMLHKRDAELQRSGTGLKQRSGLRKATNLKSQDLLLRSS